MSPSATEAGQKECGQNDPGQDEPATPVLRVVKGNPTPEELAALIVVLTAVPPIAPAPEHPPTSEWAAYWRTRQRSTRPGPGAWRDSLR